MWPDEFLACLAVVCRITCLTDGECSFKHAYGDRLTGELRHRPAGKICLSPTVLHHHFSTMKATHVLPDLIDRYWVSSNKAEISNVTISSLSDSDKGGITDLTFHEAITFVMRLTIAKL